MLDIQDLNCSEEMAREDMCKVTGGTSPLFAIDFSTGMTNKVADVQQLFAFEFVQSNTGVMTNTQMISGGNGVTLAPVHQHQHQSNDMHISDIGNIAVS